MAIFHFRAIVRAWWLCCTAVSAYESMLVPRSGNFFPLEDEITTEGLMGNLRALDSIAKANGGNRAFGLPGYRASVDYILSQTSNVTTAQVWTQDFSSPFNQIKALSLRVGEKSYNMSGLMYSPSTPEGGIKASLVAIPTGSISCSIKVYENLDVKGKIVLVERRLCPDATSFAGHVRTAASAGAAGVILYNNERSYYFGGVGGTLGAPNPIQQQKLVPAALISQADGQAIKELLKREGSIPAHFQQSQISEQRKTQNVFAETLAGDPSSVIMLGAHLDSVQAGPGINDDGSGVTLLLELFKSLQKHTSLKNKVRFAWWGAEENGLIGSNHYTSRLKSDESDNILAYLNFDMIARGYYGVFDGSGVIPAFKGPAGSEILHKLFVDAFHEKGINTTKEKFAGNSDYGSFVGKLKKPSSGLHTGSAPAQDPCYHRKCDTIDNINPSVLTTNALITARVLSILATDGSKIIPKTQLNITKSVNRVAAPAIELRGSQCGGHADLEY